MGAKSLKLLNMRMRAWGFVKSQSFAFLRKRVFRVQFLLSLALGSLSQATQAGVLWDDLKSCMANPKLCVTAIKSSLSTGTSSIADMRRNFLLQYAILKNSPQLLAQLEDILGPLALSEVDKLKIKQLQEKYAKVKLAQDPTKDDLKGFSKELVDILSHGNINPELLAKISEPLESAGLLVHSQLDESKASSAFTNEANKETASSADFEKRIENMAASGGEISNPSKANLVEEKNSKSSALSSRSDEETLDGAKVIKNGASNFKGSKFSSSKKFEGPREEIIPFDGRAPSSVPLASSNIEGTTGAGGSSDIVEETERSSASTNAKQTHGIGDSSFSSSASASSGGVSSSAPIKGSGNKTTESSSSSANGTSSETASVDTQQNGLSQNSGTQDKTQNDSTESQTNDRHVSSDSGASAKNTDSQEGSTEDIKPKVAPTNVEPAKTGVAIKGPETFKATAPEVKTADTTSVFTRQFLDAQKSKEFVRAFTSNKDVVSTPDLSEGVISMIAQGNYQQAEALIRALNPEYVEEYEKQKAKDDEVLHLTQMEKAGEISKEVLQEEVAKIIESKEKLNNSRVERRMKKKDEKSASTNTASEPLQIVSEAIAAASRNVAETSKLEIRKKEVQTKLENNLKNPQILNSKELEQCKLFYNNIFLGSSDTVIEGVKNSTKYNGNYLDTSEVKCQYLKESWRRTSNTYLMPRNSVSRITNPYYKEDLLYYCSSAYLKISAYNKLASSEAEEYIEKGLKPITSYAKYSVSDLAREDNLEIQAKLMLVAEPEELLCASLIPEYSLKKQSDLGKVHDFYKCGQSARSEKILPLYFDKKAYERRMEKVPKVFLSGKGLNDKMIDDSEGVGMPVYSTSTSLTADGQFAKTAFMFNFFKTIEIENNQVQVPFRPFDIDEFGQRLNLLEASKSPNPSSQSLKLKSDRSYTAKLYELLYGSCSQTFVGEGDACRNILSQENARMVKYALTRGNQRASRDLDKVKSELLSPEGEEKIHPFRDLVVKNLCREREPASRSVHSK